MRIASENGYYHEVSLYGVVRLTRLPGAGLSQAATVDNPVANHEIVVIVGSPSKMAKASLIEFATKLTEHTRVSQGWGGIHVIVEASPSFATGAIDDPVRLINTRPVSKGLHYKRA
jgi:hypothetical protein